MFEYIKTMAKKAVAKATKEKIVATPEVTEEKKEVRDADFYKRHTGARDEVIYG